MKGTGNEKKIRKNNLEHKGSSLGLLVSSELEAVKVKKEKLDPHYANMNTEESRTACIA